MATFPTLSVPPLVTPWEEGAAGDPTIRTPYEAGYGQTKPRFTRITWKWSVAYAGLTQTDKDALVVFEKTVKIGADSWTWTDPKTSAQSTVRLLGPVKYRYHQSDAFWSAEFSIEEV